MLILKDEHAIDVLKSGNTGHMWHDFHAIGVHATDVGHPSYDNDDDNGDDNTGDNDDVLGFRFWSLNSERTQILASSRP